MCINKLSVAEHSRTKKLRLCLDQSRYINKNYAKKKKFRIESTECFKEVVGQGDWMVCFDLKSAYHHINIHQDFWKYFGFAAIIDGREKFFAFVCLPFGFYDSARVLTKVLRHVLGYWRREALMCFIHIDDGIVNVSSEEKARAVARRVRNDLMMFGLITSPEKCIWRPVKQLTWTGIVWDTEKFKCFIPEDKLERAEKAIQSLLEKKDVRIQVKEVASICGLLMSFRHCVGEDVSRFYMRKQCMLVARETQNNKWDVRVKLNEEVVDELVF